MDEDYLALLNRLLILESRVGAVDNISEVAERIVAAGGSLDEQGEGGLSALAWACRAREASSALALLAHGASESAECAGRAPLMWATDEGDLGLVEVLLEAGADVNAADASGRTPLMNAARVKTNDNSKCVDALLAAGARVGARDANGWNALMHACENNVRAACAKLIEAGCSVDSASADGTTAAMIAARGDGAWLGSCVPLLIAGGCAVDARNGMGETALTWAARAGSHDALEDLIAAGADVEAVDGSGMTALDWAERSKNSKCMEMVSREFERSVLAKLVGEARGVGWRKRL